MKGSQVCLKHGAYVVPFNTEAIPFKPNLDAIACVLSHHFHDDKRVAWTVIYIQGMLCAARYCDLCGIEELPI